MTSRTFAFPRHGWRHSVQCSWRWVRRRCKRARSQRSFFFVVRAQGAVLLSCLAQVMSGAVTSVHAAHRPYALAAVLLRITTMQNAQRCSRCGPGGLLGCKVVVRHTKVCNGELQARPRRSRRLCGKPWPGIANWSKMSSGRQRIADFVQSAKSLLKKLMVATPWSVGKIRMVGIVNLDVAIASSGRRLAPIVHVQKRRAYSQRQPSPAWAPSAVGVCGIFSHSVDSVGVEDSALLARASAAYIALLSIAA
mmetsp:Transcript_15171/g.26939  ORF Transcript_15171/g.26939 Transcript_15171/m.26939 type:complete len:251 (-) Transcript_15171:542-1294(-)